MTIGYKYSHRLCRFTITLNFMKRVGNNVGNSSIFTAVRSDPEHRHLSHHFGFGHGLIRDWARGFIASDGMPVVLADEVDCRFIFARNFTGTLESDGKNTAQMYIPPDQEATYTLKCFDL